VKYAVWAIGLQIVLTLITTVLLWGYTSQLTQLLIKANGRLKDTDKSKRTVATYQAGSAQLIKDLHEYRVSVTVHALIVSALFGFAAYAIWRGLGLAKWLYIAAAVFFSLDGIVALEADGPKVTNAFSFIVAIAAIGATVLLVLPQSALFFAAVKALRMPPAAAGTAPRPTGLRALFAPPPPRPPRTARSGPVKPSGSRVPAGTRPGSRRAGAAANAEDAADAASTADATNAANSRGKPKARTGGVDVEAAAAAAATASPSAGSTASPSATRGRGKSRRVSP
jgi:hypothetical protein